MAGTVDAVIIFAIIVLIVIVVYLGMFHKPGKSDPNNQYTTPAGLGTSCNFSSDCPAGMYCTTQSVGGPPVNSNPSPAAVCSPYCATYYDNSKNYHDTCIVGFAATNATTSSATCVWNPAPVRAYNCQQKSCSSNSDCLSTEICSPNANGTGVCYPNNAACSTVGSNCFGTSSLVCTVASSGNPTCQPKSS